MAWRGSALVTAKTTDADEPPFPGLRLGERRQRVAGFEALPLGAIGDRRPGVTRLAFDGTGRAQHAEGISDSKHSEPPRDKRRYPSPGFRKSVESPPRRVDARR